MNNTIERPEYVKKIESYLGSPVIQVVTGLRRSGKSTILRQVKKLLEKSGRPITYIDKESLEFEEIKTAKDIVKYHQRLRLSPRKRPCLIIDEVQEIESWEKAAASILGQGGTDIIVSGSNAHLLSSELATLLSGRHLINRIHPLSYPEFITFRKALKDSRPDTEYFGDYLKYGGLPGLHFMAYEEEPIFSYLNGIINTVFLKDIVQRHQIRDVNLLERTFRFILDNIGSLTSAKKISDYAKSQRLKVSADTILNYLAFMQEAFIIQKSSRYDIKGKRLLEISEKYYTGDIGLRHGFIGFTDKDIAGLLENLIFLDLQRRGYKVTTGNLSGLEVDFIAEKGLERIYLQIAYRLHDKKTISREFGNLKKIDDNFPKYVVSLDPHQMISDQGIKHLNLIEFLLKQTPFT